MAPQLEIRRLDKQYENGAHALQGVSLTVERGEFLAVIGLSGSGKSTLLRCINGLVRPSGGEVRFHGRDLTRLKPGELRRERRRIGMIFQQFNLIPRKSVLVNVLLGRLGAMSPWQGLLGRFSAQDLAAGRARLDLVGLAEKAEVRADQLSGGQQQRVAIARALMQEPEIILADEPVASLDPATAHAVLDRLTTVNRTFGTTIICNLHFLSLVRQYASRVIALRGGEKVFEGRPEAIDEVRFAGIYGEGAREVGIR